MTRALLDELVLTFPGVDVIEGYGLTESGPIITMNPRGRNKLGTIGPALPGFECKVIDSDGKILPQGEAGELVVRSECVACDPDGWFTFRGRVDDQMNVGGENVFPAEVESILATHPEVRDVCVVPVPHEVKGQVPVAFVKRHPVSRIKTTSTFTHLRVGVDVSVPSLGRTGRSPAGRTGRLPHGPWARTPSRR